MLKLNLKIDLTGLKRLSKQYPDASKKVIDAKLTEATLLLERVVRIKTPEGAGPIHARETVFQKVTSSGMKARGIVGMSALYGESLEYGTKAHWPPPGPLEYWVARKLGITGKDVKKVAFLIARKISKKGTKGAHMFEKGFAETEGMIQKIISSIPDEIVRQVQ